MPVSREGRRRRWVFLGSLLVFFLLGFLMVLPLFDRRTVSAFYTFGNTTPTNSETAVINNYIRGYWGEAANSGTADNITVYLSTNGATSYKVKCALYAYVDYSSNYAGDFIQETEEKTITKAGVEDGWWEVFNFSSKPSISTSTKYYIAITGSYQSGAGNVYLRRVWTSGVNKAVYENTGVYGFENPWSGESASVDYHYSIYCCYSHKMVYFYMWII